MGALLQTTAVNKQFGGLSAVTDLNISINAGEIVGLIGPNGAGKTTSFNLITGVYVPTSGTVTLGTLELTTATEAQLVAATVEKDNRLREFGVVVVGVTPTTLVEGPGAFVAQLEHIVRMNAGRPPLPLVVTPCAVDPVWHSPHQTVESVR